MDYKYAPPDRWRASVGDVLVWLENGLGYYFRSEDFTLQFSPRNEDPPVFRHPLPELTSLSSVGEVMAWLGVDEPWEWTARQRDRHSGRNVTRFVGDDGSSRLILVVDDETGFVLGLSCDREQGRLGLQSLKFSVVHRDDGAFVHGDSVARYSGPRATAIQ